MDIPVELMGAVVGEGEKYFFTVDCPIGIQEHIHEARIRGLCTAGAWPQHLVLGPDPRGKKNSAGFAAG
jgi:hypothetical protein